ncbi:MAG: hypothetical protein HC905_12130 [Bacteroidales bacterium]|nr:hypothetical protein [Bacteroidales bacterium]
MADRIISIRPYRTKTAFHLFALIIAAIAAMLFYVMGTSLSSSAAILLSIYLFIMFVQTLGNYIPIMEFIFFYVLCNGLLDLLWPMQD